MPDIADILRKVQKPLRYTGGEWNAIVRDPSKTKLKIALAFPDVYEIGMSHLGLRILYHLLNRHEDFLVERVFAPWLDMERELRRHSIPLFSLENKIPLKEFDIIGFSLQYELCSTNILNILDLGQIPLRSKDRGDQHPFIIAGGPCALNPEPVADFIDAFLIGDAEEALPEVLNLFLSLLNRPTHHGNPISRDTLFQEISEISGWYVPSLYEITSDPVSNRDVIHPKTSGKSDNRQAPFPIERRFVEDLSEFPFPDQLIVPNTEIVHDRVAVEISRGCMEGCRFCQAGIIYRPLRERKPSDVFNCIAHGLNATGYGDVSLTSLSTGSYHCLGPLVEILMEKLKEKKISLSVSSLRADSLSDNLARHIGRVRKTGFTIAPEAGTQRLRDVINKGISETDILQAATNAIRNGWHQIKMYFMIGLPTETWKDVEGIVQLGQTMMAELRGKGTHRRPEITISVSTFIPKPFTPFQWDRMEDLASIRQKQEFLKESIDRLHLHFKWHDTKTSFLEGVFSRGDRRLTSVVEYAWKLGCRFDGWSEALQMNNWHQAFQACQIDPRHYLEEIPLDSRLPWDHLDAGIAKTYLQQERLRAAKAVLTPACGRPEKTTPEAIHCNHCGLSCDMQFYRDLDTRWMQDLQSLHRSSPLCGLDGMGTKEATSFYRYLACFQKSKFFRFASHLDLIRTIHRTLDRAGLSPRYTQGFHPKPDMSFGPALGVGIESMAEWMELELADSMSETEFLQRINSKCPGGLHFVKWQLIPNDAPALNRLIDSAEYLAERGPDIQEEGLLTDTLSTRIRRLLEKERIPILRKKEGQSKSVDIRPALRSIVLTDSEPKPILDFIVAINGISYARPEEVLETLLGEEATGWQIQRKAIGLLHGNSIISPIDFINTQWTGAKEKIHAKRAYC